MGFALKIGLYTITYIAYDLQREEKVIVKEYYPSQLCSRVDGGNRIGIRAGGEQKIFYERGLTQFLKEAKDLHSVSVPFLIPVQDVFTENATAYMVMPYLNGKTLEAAIEEKKRFSITETLALMMPVMDITDRLHQKGILHLNIHPGNIFLVDSGEVILMDSGRYSQSFVDAPMETIGENSRYQAPEIRNLHEKIDGSVDVYSICAIMYEMITGTEIEDGASRITKDTVKSPLSRRVKITANQDAILMNGLALHSKNRINSVEKLMKSFVSIRPVQKVEEPAAVQKKKAPERRPVERARHEKKAGSSSGSGGMLRIVLPCVLVLCIAVGGFIAFGHFKGKNTANMTQKENVTSNTEKTAPVPNVSNQTTYEKAKKAAQDAGFKLKRTDAEKVQEGEKTDIVTKQDPEPGTVAEIGSTISVTVTASNITLDNDDVLGPDVKILNYELSKDDKNILNNVFNIYSSEIESNIIPGYLLRICKGSSDDQKYSLNMNSEILKYSKITLVYSAGKTDITEGQDAGISVKELLQNNIQEALDKAENGGFYVGISQTADYKTKDVAHLGDAYMIKKLNANGKEVKMQDDDEIQTGDKILLCLSRGPKRIKINGKYLTQNTYVGVDYESAKKALETAGVTVTQEKKYSSVPEGNVISISYSCSYEKNEIEKSQQGGIHEGDSVVVTVSAGPKPTTQAPEPTQPVSGGGSSSRKPSSSRSKSSPKNSRKSNTTNQPPKGY